MMIRDGDTLRAERKARKMTTAALAKLLGVHRNTVIRWEGGDPIPGPALLSLRWIFSPKSRDVSLNEQTSKGTAA